MFYLRCLKLETVQEEEDTVSEAVQDTVPSPLHAQPAEYSGMWLDAHALELRHGETSLRPVFPTLTELQSQAASFAQHLQPQHASVACD